MSGLDDGRADNVSRTIKMMRSGGDLQREKSNQAVGSGRRKRNSHQNHRNERESGDGGVQEVGRRGEVRRIMASRGGG